MNLDEFGFVNRQLAGMLKSGIPLEGALRQLCETMRQGQLQDELRALEADLAKGVPLREAVIARQLPEFYKQMLRVGVESNDLPALLTLLADHYQRLHFAGTRLKSLLLYPCIVLVVSFAISLMVAVLFGYFLRENGGILEGAGWGANERGPTQGQITFGLWAPVVLLAGVSGLVVAGLVVRAWRRRLRWWMPGFKDAGLSQVASSIALMLQNGCTLNQALALLQQLDAEAPTGRELAQWQSRLAAGERKFPQLAGGGRIFPPLFIWLVAASGEDWTSGFKQAAQVYHDRAMYRLETLLYAVLPVSVLALGFLILGQVTPMLMAFTSIMRSLGDIGG